MGRQSDTTKEVSFRLAERYQAYNWNAKGKHDHYDTTINSPKSVKYAKDGTKFYVQSLEDIRFQYMMPPQRANSRLVIT